MFQPTPFRLSFSSLGILPPDVRQFGVTEAGIFFDGAQRVGRLDRTVLTRIAGQYDAALVTLNIFQKLQHLFTANLSRLVHDHERTSPHDLLRKKRTDGLRTGKAVALQIGDLLALGARTWTPLRILSSPALTSRRVKLLPVPGPTTKQRDEIAREYNVFRRLLLFIIQRTIDLVVTGRQ